MGPIPLKCRYCFIDYDRELGIVAETSKDNSRMIATFRNRGFEINDHQEEDVVLVSKPVA